MRPLTWMLLTFFTWPAIGSAHDSDMLQPSSFREMLGGFYYAGSYKSRSALSGFGLSNNFPKPIDKSIQDPQKELYLLALPAYEAPFRSKYRGMTLLLINGTQEAYSFPACDSRLFIIQAAKDKDGAWNEIEYAPSSGCGNSYHSVQLEPGTYWQFVAPRYEGSQKSTLKFVILAANGKTIFSNEFAGSVNPQQFIDNEPNTLDR